VTDSIRVAAVQPRGHTLGDESRNLEDALSWMDRAAAVGAELVVFPEGYPGPTNPVNDYDALSALRERAASHRQHVVAGAIEPSGHGGHNVILRLIDDAGELAASYRRTTPEGPYIYRDIDAWGFDYDAADDPPQVVDTRIGRIGMQVCTEVWVPELSRVLALQGADLIVYPAGGAINELMTSWRTLLRARAIENLVYTVATQNLYGAREIGVGLISGPEEILVSSDAEGMLVADLDLARLRYLRREQERIVMPKPYRTIPGIMRWRRPALYNALAAQEPGEDR
jgi:predicted amidohydrolase